MSKYLKFIVIMSKVSVYEYNLKSSLMINLSDQLLRNQSPLVIYPAE